MALAAHGRGRAGHERRALSFLANEIGELCRELPAARQRFCQLRDDAESAALTAPAEGIADAARFDWIVLNASLGEATRTLSWFDALAPETQLALPTAIISRLLPMLLELERWADAGRLIRIRSTELRTHGVMLHMSHTYPMSDTVEPYRTALQETMLEGLREEAAQLVRSCRPRAVTSTRRP